MARTTNHIRKQPDQSATADGQPRQFIKQGEIKTLPSFSTNEIYRHIAAGTFLRLVIFESKSAVWNEDQILAWREARIIASRGEQYKMGAKKTAYQAVSSKHTNLNSISSEAQRTRILARLQNGPVDTITARRELNILHPAARVQELRDRGHRIYTHRITITDSNGRTYSGIALYYLDILPTDISVAA